MNLHLHALSSLAVVIIIYFLLSAFLENRRHTRRAMEMECLPPHQRHQRYPLGLDLLMPILKADQERVLPGYFMDLYLHKLGKRDTWQQDILGLKSIWTVDPKNIQTILAVKFQDYDLGSLRRKNFFPVLGNEIFTVDGKAWEHSRSLLRIQFARQQVADLDLEESHVMHLLKHLPTHDGWTDQSVNSQNAALADSSKNPAPGAAELDWTNFAACFDGATSALGVRGLLGLLYWMWSPPSFRQNCKEIYRFADYYVNLALKGSTQLNTSGQEKNEQNGDIFSLKNSSRPLEIQQKYAADSSTSWWLAETQLLASFPEPSGYFYAILTYSKSYDKLLSTTLVHFTIPKPLHSRP